MTVEEQASRDAAGKPTEPQGKERADSKGALLAPSFEDLINKSKHKQKSIAQQMGITGVTFSYKKKHPDRFLVSELLKLATLLDIAPEVLLAKIIAHLASPDQGKKRAGGRKADEEK